MYNFFVQPQIDKASNSLFGYELLLREETDGQWHLPADFTKLSIPKQVQLVIETAKIIKKKNTNNKFISFNLNRTQAMNPATIGEIILLQKYIFPMHLIVELTEAIPFARAKMISFLLHQHKIELVIDDVGTGSNTFENIKAILPYVDKIKFAMQNLRMSGQAQLIPDQLNFWVEQAEEYCLDFILEGVETTDDQLLAKKMGINLQQGYLYGKPDLI